MRSSSMVNHISECFVKPRYEVHESKRRYYLSPLDMRMLSLHYIQIGLLYPKPTHINNGQTYSTPNLLESLENSLSQTLYHFYPLAGQLATNVDEDWHKCSIFVDCHKGPGAKLIHAAALGVSISDILTPVDVPDKVVHSLLDHHGAVNYDGHSRSLLSIQVTELQDGLFIGCSMNQVVVDKTSFWNFWNVWSENHRAINSIQFPIPHPPINDRWFPLGKDLLSAVTLPFTHPDEFITRHEKSVNRTRVFHFSAESLARLKCKARKESSNGDISSMQALFALFWRAYVRVNRLWHDNLTNCVLVANDRHRVNPPLSLQYFGNFIEFINNKIKVSDLLEHNLGWAASLLNHSVANHDNKVVRDYIPQLLNSPYTYSAADDCFNRNNLMLMNSSLFDVYGNDFGFGKPLAMRSGNMFKYGGIVVAYQGNEGGGSIDLEICLSPDSMTALESDLEFKSVVSVPYWLLPSSRLPNVVSKM